MLAQHRLLVRMQRLELGQQRILVFLAGGILLDAVGRARGHALRLGEVADALGAEVRVDLEWSSPSLMAPFGHSGSQAPQLLHSSLI